jgi:hypothetical protein
MRTRTRSPGDGEGHEHRFAVCHAPECGTAKGEIQHIQVDRECFICIGHLIQLPGLPLKGLCRDVII